MLYGYAYATDAQEAQRQRTALVKAGCERVYADVYEDDDPHRQMEALLDALRPGDEIVIGSKEQFAARRLHGRMLGLALRRAGWQATSRCGSSTTTQTRCWLDRSDEKAPIVTHCVVAVGAFFFCCRSAALRWRF